MADGQIAQKAVREVRLADYLPPAFAVDRVELEFELSPSATIVRATLKLRRTGHGKLVLDGEGLTLLGVKLDGETLGDNRFQVSDTALTLDDVPDEFMLATEVRIAPDRNTALSGLYMSGAGFFTQCEPEGFRRITYFPDRPDVMARYGVTLRADKAVYPVLLSNGNRIAAGDGPDGTHWARWEDPHPKPSYLFALVAADLVAVKDEFTTRSGRPVELGIYVAAGDESRVGHAMAAVKSAMRWDEDTFGLEYDLDVFNIAAVADFNAGAMENKGLNIFNTAYVLASPETASDADFQGVERVIAHEYFHNWTGDRVTCRDWFQLSLKEGLTVFRDQEYMADQFSAPVKRIADVRLLRTTQFRNDAGPLAHSVRPESYQEINNFYTTTIYEKGAEVVRMVRTLIGREAFRKGFDLYIARHDNTAATVEDFLAAMQDATDVDLKQMLNWYEQAGTPEVETEENYDAAARRFSLTLRQNTRPTPNSERGGQAEKKPFLMPVAVGLLDPSGDEVLSQTLLLREAEQTFTFEDIAAPPAVSLFRGFSAPVKLLGRGPERLAFLAAHDTDLFNRWDALQQYAMQLLLAAVAAGGEQKLDAGLRAAFANLLRDAPADPAFTAEALLLPNESLLADEMEVVDPDAIHAARGTMRRELGRALRDEFAAVLEGFAADPTDFSGEAIGRRALRNTALAYLAAAGEAERAAAQFAAGRTMTETLAALMLLVDIPGAAREAALAAFYERWRGNPLVLDKWFAVQARAEAPDTLDRVRVLTKHADFDIRNPNRVRALIGAFISNAPVFHTASGDGYRLLAECVIELDSLNPQIAARLVTALGAWRRYDAGRQALMQAELQRILRVETLSRNTYEMASKALI